MKPSKPKPGELSAFIELVDATEILDAKTVDDLFHQLLRDDPSMVSEGPKWNQDFTVPMEFIIEYRDTAIPDFAALLDPIGERLMSGEYLIFEEKVRHVYRLDGSMRTILVTHEHVEYIDASAAVADLRMKALAIKEENDRAANSNAADADFDSDTN